MSISNISDTTAFRAATALAQYSAVYQTSGMYVSAAVLNSTPGVGFVQQAATTADDIVEVAFEVGSETLAIAGANDITIGQELMCSTSATLIAATTGTHVVAIAREASNAINDIIRVQIADYDKL